MTEKDLPSPEIPVFTTSSIPSQHQSLQCTGPTTALLQHWESCHRPLVPQIAALDQQVLKSQQDCLPPQCTLAHELTV